MDRTYGQVENFGVNYFEGSITMNIHRLKSPVVLLLMLLGCLSHAAAQETKIKWFGHAAFSITTPKGKVLLKTSLSEAFCL